MEQAGVGEIERAARNATRSHGDLREAPTWCLSPVTQ